LFAITASIVDVPLSI